jgi:hypothetical protein
MRDHSKVGGWLRAGKRPSRTTRVLTLAFVLAMGFGSASLVSDAMAQVVGAQFDNARLERLRGLKFTRPVLVVAMKPEEAQKVIERDLERDYSDERLRADGIAGSMVGLFPPGFDLKAEILRQAQTQFGGVYSQHLKEIVLSVHGSESYATIDMSWLASWSGFLGNSLAHELTHALQDQHFDLEGRQEKLKDESDQRTAFASVVEGDATLAAVAYTGDGLDVSVVNRLVSNLYGMTRRMNTWASDNKVPEGLSVPEIFAHTEGIKFVAEAYRHGGWRAVDALYSNPPVSTQQILNPQLYFDAHRSPAKIQLDGYQEAMPSAKVIHIDTDGELPLRVILQRNGGAEPQYTSLAERWSGDRMAVLSQGGSITVIWMLAFSDPTSAPQFASVYSAILDRINGASTPHLVNYRANAVLAVIGDGLRQHPDLPSRIWTQTTIAASK